MNNTRIVNQTKLINNIKSETKTLAGTGPRKVMVNEGPGAELIERSAARKISPVPIGDAVKQTPVPQEVARKANEAPRKDQPNEPASRSNRSSTPGVAPEAPPSQAPSGKASGPPKGRNEGKGHDKGKP